MPLNTARPPHGMLGEFASADALVAALNRVHEEGFRHVEAFSPYPLPEAAEALGYRHSGVEPLVLGGGLIGGTAAFSMLYWISAIDYPLNVGGRPLNSWPLFIPITFELTILTAALMGLLAVLLLCDLPRFHHPLFAADAFVRATIDRFFVCIEATDPQYDPARVRDLLHSLGAIHIEEVPK